jgi:hypothetical protein
MAEAHEELQELRENAESGAERRMAEVSLTMAVLAVLVAVITLFGHRAHTEEILLQTKLTDQWAFYQAKNTQGHLAETFLDQLQVFGTKGEAADKAREKYQGIVEHQQERQKEIQAEARSLEAEIGQVQRHANRFDLAEGVLEAALVITSITLLTKRRRFWHIGLAAAAAGIAIGVLGFLAH